LGPTQQPRLAMCSNESALGRGAEFDRWWHRSPLHQPKLSPVRHRGHRSGPDRCVGGGISGVRAEWLTACAGDPAPPQRPHRGRSSGASHAKGV